MKYSFITNNDEITIEVSSKMSVVKKTINFDDEETFDETIKDIIDNMRMTVKEREEALTDLNMFKEYILKNTHRDEHSVIINE